MQTGTWQKEKDPVTVMVFWALVSSLQSKQESGFCGNKPSMASSNFVLFCLMPKSCYLQARFLAKSIFLLSKQQVQG